MGGFVGCGLFSLSPFPCLVLCVLFTAWAGADLPLEGFHIGEKDALDIYGELCSLQDFSSPTIDHFVEAHSPDFIMLILLILSSMEILPVFIDVVAVEPVDTDLVFFVD